MPPIINIIILILYFFFKTMAIIELATGSMSRTNRVNDTTGGTLISINWFITQLVF